MLFEASLIWQYTFDSRITILLNAAVKSRFHIRCALRYIALVARDSNRWNYLWLAGTRPD